MRLRKLACHGARRGEKCSSCSLRARVKRENRAHSAQELIARASIGTVDAFGVRLLVSCAAFKLANRTELVAGGRWLVASGSRRVTPLTPHRRSAPVPARTSATTPPFASAIAHDAGHSECCSRATLIARTPHRYVAAMSHASRAMSSCYYRGNADPSLRSG